jgi:hypothetical protein
MRCKGVDLIQLTQDSVQFTVDVNTSAERLGSVKKGIY